MSWIETEVTPSSLSELGDVLARDRGDFPWMPRGGGTLLGRGALPKTPVRSLNLSRCHAVIEHAYDDLTVTVEAGITLTALQATLAEHGQWLPVSLAPDSASTVGGWIGADRRAPLVGSWGSIRDYLLGIAWMDGRGRTLRAGGRVVKNVAGYDLMKLFTGSLGELGVIVEATFKVMPLPAAWGAVTLFAPDASALRRVRDEGPKLFPAGLFRYDLGEGDSLALVFAGSQTRIGAQAQRALALLSSQARVLAGDETRVLVASLEGNTRPRSDHVAWGGALSEWLCRPGMTQILGNGHWCADLLRGHIWSQWNGDETALVQARAALRDGDGHLHLDAPSMQPLVAPWGRTSENNDILTGLKRALDPDGRFVVGRWPVNQ